MRTQVDVTSKSVRELLERGEEHRLVDVLGNLRPGDISRIMMELNEKDQSSVFSILVQHDRRLAAETLKVLGVEPGLDLSLIHISEPTRPY